MKTLARSLSGTAAAAAARERVRARVAALRARGVVPGLGVIQVGRVLASDVYVGKKLEAARDLGFEARHARIEPGAGERALLEAVRAFNTDPALHGFLVQMPLPDGWDEDAALGAVDPARDLDGFHPLNVGLTTLGSGGFWPCTALGVRELLEFHAVPLAGRHVVVVGRSRVVGRPLATLLSQRGADATVTLCHSASGDLARYTRAADIVVMAAGRARLLRGEMIQDGAVVVDVGIHSLEDPARPGKRRLVGDVDAESVGLRAAWLSPVPGGVGPMTVAMLMQNAALAAERSLER